MTGDATGPHLHLQLDPTTSYPQDEAWFQCFAGTAFSWQDAPTPAPAGGLQPIRTVQSTQAGASAPVFAVVPSSQQQPVVIFDRP